MIKNIEKEVEQITKWIKEYVEASHSKGVVVGNSGGKDSATVIALATKALGKENVVTIAMPCNSINADFEDAKYYVAQSLDYLVIGTGNKCEALVGYTTKWGDSAHDFNPIGDFTVEEVLQIGEYIETGETEESAMKIIKRKEKTSLHKRMPIPVYKKTVTYVYT